MSEVSISFEGWDDWEQYIRLIAARAKDFNKILLPALNIFGFKDIQDHFREESGPGGPWPERSDFTQMMYLRRNKTNAVYDPGNKLLQLTGRLRQSIMRGKSGGAKAIGKNTAAIQSNVEYSGKHDQGEGKIPQRQFMWLSDKAVDNINKMILDFLTEGNTLGGSE
jgi:phage gpG-like protein